MAYKGAIMSQRNGAFEHLHLQYAMVCFFLVFCISLLVMTFDHAVVQTGVLVILVSVIGLFLISRLPRSLEESLKWLRSCEPLQNLMGERFVNAYIHVKEKEYQTYFRVISSWEREFLLLNV